MFRKNKEGGKKSLKARLKDIKKNGENNRNVLYSEPKKKLEKIALWKKKSHSIPNSFNYENTIAGFKAFAQGRGKSVEKFANKLDINSITDKHLSKMKSYTFKALKKSDYDSLEDAANIFSLSMNFAHDDLERVEMTKTLSVDMKREEKLLMYTCALDTIDSSEIRNLAIRNLVDSTEWKVYSKEFSRYIDLAKSYYDGEQFTAFMFESMKLNLKDYELAEAYKYVSKREWAQENLDLVQLTDMVLDNIEPDFSASTKQIVKTASEIYKNHDTLNHNTKLVDLADNIVSGGRTPMYDVFIYSHFKKEMAHHPESLESLNRRFISKLQKNTDDRGWEKLFEVLVDDYEGDMKTLSDLAVNCIEDSEDYEAPLRVARTLKKKLPDADHTDLAEILVDKLGLCSRFYYAEKYLNEIFDTFENSKSPMKVKESIERIVAITPTLCEIMEDEPTIPMYNLLSTRLTEMGETDNLVAITSWVINNAPTGYSNDTKDLLDSLIDSSMTFKSDNTLTQTIDYAWELMNTERKANVTLEIFDHLESKLEEHNLEIPLVDIANRLSERDTNKYSPLVMEYLNRSRSIITNHGDDNQLEELAHRSWSLIDKFYDADAAGELFHYFIDTMEMIDKGPNVIGLAQDMLIKIKDMDGTREGVSYACKVAENVIIKYGKEYEKYEATQKTAQILSNWKE